MISNYLFNNLGRIGDDFTDKSQRNIQNSRYTDLNLTNYFSSTVPREHVDFVSNTPGLSYNGLSGPGLSGTAVVQENKLLWGSEIERPFEKVQLFTRPFATVPYLGRGSGDPTLESRLQQGDYVNNKKSISTVPEENIDQPNAFPLTTSNQVEEIALKGWSRGGLDTRITGDKYFSNK